MRYNWVPWYSVHARRERTSVDRYWWHKTLRELWALKGTLYGKGYEEREAQRLREQFGVEDELPKTFEVMPEMHDEDDGEHGYRHSRSSLDYAMSYIEIGRVLEVSPERVRQIEQRALGKLRVRLTATPPRQWTLRIPYPECVDREAYSLCK